MGYLCLIQIVLEFKLSKSVNLKKICQGLGDGSLGKIPALHA